MPIPNDCQFAELLKILRIVEGKVDRHSLEAECNAALFMAIQSARKPGVIGELTLKISVAVEDGVLVPNYVVRSISKAKLTEGKGASKVDLDESGQLVLDLDDSDSDDKAA